MEENFKIQMGAHYIDIVNYTKIKEITASTIIVLTDSLEIKITGSRLAIQRLLKDEVFITGQIASVLLGGSHAE